MDLNKIISLVAENLKISSNKVSKTWELLDSGATIPFIARYRKEVTGGLDEVQIANIKEQVESGIEFEKRKAFILKSITEQGLLNSSIESALNKAQTLNELEDIYLPFKPKRRTKATIAKEKGLEPFAKTIYDQLSNVPANQLAEKYISSEKGVESIEDAFEGAKHIIAEWINEDAILRSKVRNLFTRTAQVKTKVIASKKEEGEKYRDYFEWEEPLAKMPSHRLLAIRRGEKELILRMDVAIDQEDAENALERSIVKSGVYKKELNLAIKDAYKRLMKPSIETEFRLESKKKADQEAIKVFAENLKELLLASPLGQKRILAIDPGFRTGCKVVALDAQGKLLKNETIYPHEPQKKTQEAEHVVRELVKKYDIEAIAIGNGTAGRETESFVKKLELSNVHVISVNESGASIYSASEVAREEFPTQDITVRGAVSIGRRLADPLSELVKIDAKSIGVGQYQHDVDQSALKTQLDDVVISCVNAVGVDANTASKQLLTYVSGLGPQLAQNVIDYRKENGAFTSRTQLKKVARMEVKAYEQCAGFLRVNNGKEILDRTAVHPESYKVVKQMASDLNSTVETLISSSDLRKQIDLKKYVSSSVGLPTLTDIVAELEKPGRDPRKEFEIFSFAEGINEISDLHEGMELDGIVTNVTNFGAFVDIGVHQDGLVHVSQLADKFVSDPKEVVKVNQQVKVRVTEVDASRKRISLSMKSQRSTASRKPKDRESSKNDLAALKGKWQN